MSEAEIVVVAVYRFPNKNINYFVKSATGQVLMADHTQKEVYYIGEFGSQSTFAIFVATVELPKDWFDWLPLHGKPDEIKQKIKECVEKYGDLNFLIE